MNPFEFFGIKPSFELDLAALETKYYALSREFHPDRAARGDRQKQAELQQKSAELNRSYLALKDPETRIDVLLEIAGKKPVHGAQGDKNQIPMELAEEYFELQEAMMDDPESTSTKVSEFSGKVSRMAIDLDREIYAKAAHLDWTSSQAVDALIDLRRRRSYLLSLIENTRKIREVL